MHDWLTKQKTYQEETYSVDLDAMQTDADARTEFVTWNLYALIHEAVEAGRETPWKPWSAKDKAQAWSENRDAFVDELVDVAFFLANAALAAGVTDAEWDERYERKRGVNTERQATGYEGNPTR